MRREHDSCLDLADERMDDFRFWRDVYLSDRSNKVAYYIAKSYAKGSRDYLRIHAEKKKAPNAAASGASE